MPFKTCLKIWYSVNWRTFVYSLTLYFYLASLFSLILLYCLNQGLLETCRHFVLTLFNLSESREIPVFSLSRIMLGETLNAAISFPLLFIALRHLPSIPFKGFRITYPSIWRPFLLLGPGAFLIYLLSYLSLCAWLQQENEIIQGILALLISFMVIPYAFDKTIIHHET